MRCAVMEYILAPIATWAGLRKKKPIVRFAEQAWIMLYYGAFWLTGMVRTIEPKRSLLTVLSTYITAPGTG